MKARTKTNKPGNYIFFCYEDGHGDTFRTWHEVATEGVGCSRLVGYFYSSYFNSLEVIDDEILTGRPTIQMVKDFIQRCKDCIMPPKENKVQDILGRCKYEIAEYEERVQRALDIMGEQRCSLESADYGLVDRIAEIIEEYGDDNDLDTDDIAVEDIIWGE